jgi:hypothetical protein
MGYDPSWGQTALCAKLIEKLREFNSHMSIPTLKVYGVDHGKFESVVEVMTRRLSPAARPGTTPKYFRLMRCVRSTGWYMTINKNKESYHDREKEILC